MSYNDYENFDEPWADGTQYTDSPQPSGSGSGLKLVLPPLKATKSKKGKKLRGSSSFLQNEGVQKTPRPPKLKPLREVLAKLIAQIKKKDDYAFFLQPVDTSSVPSYTDIITKPMDFGTMTDKVQRGRYRTLEEFASDFRLVVNNAKTFNPPGTIYHVEAEKIEQWGCDHIAKAAATVIEYETDWNIDIERDDVEAVDDNNQSRSQSALGTEAAMDVDGMSRRSPSTASTAQPGKRGRPSNTGKKPEPPGKISESLDEEGRMPGSKDGLGAFPPGSDWAQLMLASKLKGKRRRTKKERVKLERSGRPYCADGSLDYAGMDDPFSELSVFMEETPAVPQLTPLFPVTQPSFPAPVNVSIDRPLPYTPPRLTHPAPPSSKRRHWNIVHQGPSRNKGKDGNEDVPPSWKTPRDAHLVDYGPYAELVDRLAQEAKAKDIRNALGSEENLVSTILQSIDKWTSSKSKSSKDPEDVVVGAEYWTIEKARQAEEYIRDVVYGGVNGQAYVRSIAEFVSPPEDSVKAEGPSSTGLGVPLAQYVERTVVNPLTNRQHRLLHEAALDLLGLCGPSRSSEPNSIHDQVSYWSNIHPEASQSLECLQAVTSRPIDMANLILEPYELFASENEWAGREYKEKEKRSQTQGSDLLDLPGCIPLPGGGGFESTHVLQYALDCSAETIVDRARKLISGTETPLKEEENEKSDEVVDGDRKKEEEVMRKLRLNLLALSKRAPLDKIAKLPAELVPPHVRHVVPTIDT